MTGVFVRRQEDTETHTEDGNKKMEAEIGMKGLQSQKMTMINAITKRQERSGAVLSSESTEGLNHINTLILIFYHSPICPFHLSYLICLHTLLFIVFNYNYF